MRSIVVRGLVGGELGHPVAVPPCTGESVLPRNPEEPDWLHQLRVRTLSYFILQGVGFKNRGNL